jgi:ATP-dependent DNA helicase RecQ
LLRLDLIRQSQDGFSTVALTEAGRAALKDGRPFVLVRPPAATRDSATAVAKAGDIPCDEGLFAALRTVRKDLADARDVPPYVVFSDVALRHMARDYPTDPAALLHIPGVGERKLADFGAPMLEAIAVWIGNNTRQSFTPIRASAEPVRKMKSDNGLNATALATLESYKSGSTIDQIAKERGLATSTVESHLAKAIEAGEKLDPRSFYSADEEAEIRAAFIGHEGLALKPVFEKLGERIGYGILKLFLAFEQAQAGKKPGCDA